MSRAADDDTDSQAPSDLTRRDVLHGVATGLGAALLPLAITGCDQAASGIVAPAQDRPGYYPPRLTGLRGSHPGTVEVGHALRDGAPLPAMQATGEVYDLIVVGAGISGLTAAQLYRRQRPGARVLILENHDDFGGHAKRNEFRSDDGLTLMNGGTYSIESPRPYSAVASAVLADLGIDAAALEKRVQQRDYYPSKGLCRAVFLDRQTFGSDHLVRQSPGESWSKLLADAPLSARARADIARLEDGPPDFLPGLTPEARQERLGRISYRDYLLEIVRADPEVVRFYQQRTHGLFAVGIDAVSALDAGVTGLPGLAGMEIGKRAGPLMGVTTAGFLETGGSVDVHLPDGGATIARALVRSLVPKALPGATLDDLVTAVARYDELDRAGSDVRIRLNATVVRAANRGGSGIADAGVRVEYLRAGRGHSVLARHCVLACWNAVIPHLCPELPAEQQAALHEAVKAPLVYANVALRNAEPLYRLGVSNIHAPGGYFCDIDLNECVRLGGYASPREPQQTALLRLTRTPCAPGRPEQDQNRLGRAELLATSFADFEREIRAQLGQILGPAGLDPQRDIRAITVNRWPHGYAPEFNSLFDTWTPDDERPCVRGRARHGAIAIANSDAAAAAYMDAAIEQAHRAVGELLSS
jgi:spermidine dehydrogenase